jgi:hypothetical protein
VRRKVVVFTGAPALLAACAQIFGAKDISVDADGGAAEDARASEASRDAPENGGDAGADGSSLGACDPSQPFGPDTSISQLRTGDLAARFTSDELTMFVWRDDPEFGDSGTFVATRGDAGGAFLPLSPIIYGGGDGGPYRDVAPSEDGLTVIVEGFDPTGAQHLFQAKRASLDASFEMPTRIVLSSDTDQVDTQGYLPSSRGVLYFSARSGALPDLYNALPIDGGWQPGAAITELNTDSSEVFPTLTPDEKTIYFGSDRGDGSTDMDIWVAYRDSATSEFKEPRLVPELSTPDFEVPTWVSADGCRLVYRRQVQGVDTIYITKRGP